MGFEVCFLPEKVDFSTTFEQYDDAYRKMICVNYQTSLNIFEFIQPLWEID